MVQTFNDMIRTAVSGMADVEVLDMVNALAGRRLCENTVGLLEEKGVASWQSPNAVDNTEWLEQIRTAPELFAPYQLQEDGHPNYWGQLAPRNCLRRDYNGGAPHGGYCVRESGLDPDTHEPNMSLTAPPAP